MESVLKRIVISKEDAVFRLDRYGRWWNASGRFTHKRIIDHFHQSIRKDGQGFHLYQAHGNIEEKVYFPYEDTALFVFDVMEGDPVTLVLNTGREVVLSPELLFTKGEDLYVSVDGDPARFIDRSLMKIAPWIEPDETGYVFISGGSRFPIQATSGVDSSLIQ